MSARIAVVTATINFHRAYPFIESWVRTAAQPVDLYIIEQGTMNRDWEQRIFPLPSTLKPWPAATSPETPHLKATFRAFCWSSRDILGVVPAFARGVKQALHEGHHLIACFHDDLEIEQQDWDTIIWGHFKQERACGLAGFGGATGLGSDDIYRSEYSPMQLARQQFGSNMRHAEAHGERWTEPRRIACLDGFSQIGTRDFWLGHPLRNGATYAPASGQEANLFTVLETVGVVHHAYDAALGAFAHQLGYQCWFLPVKVHHHGGLTAVADPKYHQWADEFCWYNAVTGEEVRGDAGYWHQSHSAVYQMFRNVLPIRI